MHYYVVENHAFIGVRATFWGEVTSCEQVLIGLGAIIQSGLTKAPCCFTSAGAEVVVATEADSVSVGIWLEVALRTALEESGA